MVISNNIFKDFVADHGEFSGRLGRALRVIKKQFREMICEIRFDLLLVDPGAILESSVTICKYFGPPVAWHGGQKGVSRVVTHWPF